MRKATWLGLLALTLVLVISLSAGMGYLKIAWLDVLRVVGGQCRTSRQTAAR